MSHISIHPTSENSVLITWPEKICPVQHQSILSTLTKINDELNAFIIESLASYNSIIIYYHFDKVTLHQLKQRISNCITQATNEKFLNEDNNLITEIPVYYGDDAGWDLNAIAQQCQLSTEDVIKLHSEQVYRAYALGFTPGFCYLGTLNKKLMLPRKSTPRLAIPKGAVAIAEQQTAVYPNICPGGWHILGQTPVALYQTNNNSFEPLIQIGQQIKFVAIDKETYIELAGKSPITEEKM